MIRYYSIIFIYIILISLLLQFNYYILNNNYIFYMYKLKNKILFLENKYKNCNSTNSPLDCGHKYEGYKIQKKGIHPRNVIVNLHDYLTIKLKTNIECKNRETIVGIVCAPEQFMERIAYRMAYNEYKRVELLFFTGLSYKTTINNLLTQESSFFNDIVVFDFISHYFNSSLMLILETNWVYNKCKYFKYFIYHTPDVFFNYYLYERTYLYNKYISCNVIAQVLYKNRVLRSNYSRFYVPYYVYNETYYPPQPNGPLIIFYRKALRIIISNFTKIRNSFWMDDVYLSFLLYHSKIKMCNIRNVVSMYPVQIKSLPNLYKIFSELIYIHSLPPASIYFLLQSCNKYYKDIA